MNIIIIKKTPANKIGNNLAIESDTIIKETKKKNLQDMRITILQN